MLWVLWDIFLPVLAAFVAGIFVGWLFWRWRRTRIDAETVSALRRNTTRLKTDADNLRARNAELSDRLQTASVATTQGRGDGAASNELSVAKRRIDTLSSELKSSRLEVNRLRDSGAGGAASDQSQLNRTRDLEARLQGANRKIADLEQASRSQNTGTPGDLSRVVAERDRMIETLKKSLAQYGDASDTTMLEADLVLRDNKISALEALLEKANHRSS